MTGSRSDSLSTETVIRHAGRMDDDRNPLCGAQGRATRPKETVNCPDCRVILNHIRSAYPAHAEYTDWRLTKAEKARAAEDMYRDLVLGGAGD
jgi:hypothetical protein